MAERYNERDERDRYGREYDRPWRGEEHYGARGWSRSEHGRDDDPRRAGDRRFPERMTDEVRSWFGDEEAQRRREMDERREQREREWNEGWAHRGAERWRGQEFSPRDDARDRDDWRWRDEAPDWSRRATGGYGRGSGSMRDQQSGDWSRRSSYSGYNPDYSFEDRQRRGSEGWSGSFGRSTTGWGTDYGHGRYSGKGPRNYQRSDERIREEVCDRLTQHGEVDASNVEIDVRNGEITLRGSVDSRAEKRIAEDVAEAISGVRQVHNQLRVERHGEQQPGNFAMGASMGTAAQAEANVLNQQQRQHQGDQKRR
jgi:osmotically-inducible protein OsmY